MLISFVPQVGEPSAVLLLKCSADTMSSRLQCRGRSTSTLHPASDRDSALHRRAESFCSDSQAVASHYEGKKLLHTVSVLGFFFCFFLGGQLSISNKMISVNLGYVIEGMFIHVDS